MNNSLGKVLPHVQNDIGRLLIKAIMGNLKKLLTVPKLMNRPDNLEIGQ